MIPRILSPIKSNSFFLFGARGTGKTTFARHFAGEGAWLIDLLDPEQEDRFAKAPKLLESDLSARERPEWIIIDEVQKVPRLLDVAQRLIEDQKQKFVLTGSSARKLKRGAANLLAGRAYVNSIFPFSALELGQRFDLRTCLRFGSLPKASSLIQAGNAREACAYLRSYVHTYLREEIQLEQVVRKLDPFRSFLDVAAQMSGKQINASKIAKDVGVDHKTVQSYFQILEDTLLGFYLPAFHLSVRKSQKVAPKFYLFDLGVRNYLAGSLDEDPTPSTSYFGNLFEQLVIQEIHRLNLYADASYQMSYFETSQGAEVDLILSKGRRHLIIEIKSTERIDETEVKKLARRAEAFGGDAQVYYLSRDGTATDISGVRCRPWLRFLAEAFRPAP